jgi:hypothetical protein
VSNVPVTERADNPPVIGPGHDYGTVTDRISDVVLKFPLETRWLIPFGLAFADDAAIPRAHLPGGERHRNLGQ